MIVLRLINSFIPASHAVRNLAWIVTVLHYSIKHIKTLEMVAVSYRLDINYIDLSDTARSYIL